MPTLPSEEDFLCPVKSSWQEMEKMFSKIQKLAKTKGYATPQDLGIIIKQTEPYKGFIIPDEKGRAVIGLIDSSRIVETPEHHFKPK